MARCFYFIPQTLPKTCRREAPRAKGRGALHVSTLFTTREPSPPFEDTSLCPPRSPKAILSPETLFPRSGNFVSFPPKKRKSGVVDVTGKTTPPVRSYRIPLHSILLVQFQPLNLQKHYYHEICSQPRPLLAERKREERP